MIQNGMLVLFHTHEPSHRNNVLHSFHPRTNGLIPTSSFAINILTLSFTTQKCNVGVKQHAEQLLLCRKKIGARSFTLQEQIALA